MKNIVEKLSEINWGKFTKEIAEKGYTIIPQLITPEECQNFINDYDNPDLYRKTIVMEKKGYGSGEYKYFKYPLNNLITIIRKEIYLKLAPVANSWMKILKTDKHFPDTFEELQKLCHENNQLQATPLILKYSKGDFNCLHQDLYGNIFFPVQLAIFLNDPEKEYTGGEFVLVQEDSHSQSKAIVLKPKKGDMIVFTTNFMPVNGELVQVKHGVSEILSGERHTLGIIFHDALS